MEVTEIKYFIEAAMLAAGKPLSIDNLQGLFDESSAPEKAQLREALDELRKDYEPRGIEIGEVASGFRMQVRSTMAERLNRLWEERPPRYSRALFETLALIAYRQPMTRGEIEEIRGVSVSANIMRSLLERDWVRVVGHRDVPGRPAMFGTTRQFLDYFGLKKLDDLPPLADLADWESLRVQLNLPDVNEDDDARGDPDEEHSPGAVVTPLPLGQRDDEGDEAAMDDAPVEQDDDNSPDDNATAEERHIADTNETDRDATDESGEDTPGAADEDHSVTAQDEAPQDDADDAAATDDGDDSLASTDSQSSARNG